MIQKRDKKTYFRRGIRIKNEEVAGDLYDYYDYNEKGIDITKSAKKAHRKGDLSQKTGIKLTMGRVIEIASNYSVICEVNGKNENCTLSGRFKIVQMETRNIATVGDYVYVDMSDDEPYRIEEIKPRKNSLSRIINNDSVMIAANIDQVVITSSYKNPEIKFGLIDRYLCAAEIMCLEPILCVNKMDLVEDKNKAHEECTYYLQHGYPVVFTSTVTGEGMDELKKLLVDKDSLFSGHSGSGKSSIIQCLQPSLNLRIGDISDYTSKGRHTTTASRLYRWDFGGHLIDTPGIKTFGLDASHKELIPKAFPGFANYTDYCQYPDCTHTHEEFCAIKEQIKIGRITKDIYDSYVRIYNSL